MSLLGGDIMHLHRNPRVDITRRDPRNMDILEAVSVSHTQVLASNIEYKR